MKILCASLFLLFLASPTYGQHIADLTIGVCSFKALNTSQIDANRFAATLAVDGKLTVRDRAALIDELAGEPMPAVEDAAAAQCFSNTRDV